MRNYRNAFVFALVGNLALLAVLGGLWWRGKQHRQPEAAMQPPSTEAATAASLDNPQILAATLIGEIWGC